MATKKNTAVKHGNKTYDYYRITRTIGHKWENGKKKPIKKQFTGTSKGNAEQKYKEFLENQAKKTLETEVKIQAQKMKTFGEYAKEYNNDILPTLNYTNGTKKQYTRNYNVHVFDTYLNSLPICEVDVKTLQNFYNGLNVSKQTLNSIHSWFSAFYKWLVANNYSENIIVSIIKPKKCDNKKSTDIIIWEQDEIKKIYAASFSFRYRFIFLLMYYAGLRISECLGLKYSDFKDNTIHIDRQYYRTELRNPKYDSFRKIPAHTEILNELNIQTEKHKTEMIKKNYKTDFIFTTNKGKLLDYHNVRDSFIRFYKRNNITEKKLHAYRATFCTELCRAGVPLEVASKLMGHKSIEVTARHYALVKQDVKIDAINKLPSYL